MARVMEFPPVLKVVVLTELLELRTLTQAAHSYALLFHIIKTHTVF